MNPVKPQKPFIQKGDLVKLKVLKKSWPCYDAIVSHFLRDETFKVVNVAGAKTGFMCKLTTTSKNKLKVFLKAKYLEKESTIPFGYFVEPHGFDFETYIPSKPSAVHSMPVPRCIQMPIEFYLVWSPEKGKPSKKHYTREDAEKEAERLTQKEGVEFHVLKSVSKCKPKTSIVWERN